MNQLNNMITDTQMNTQTNTQTWTNSLFIPRIDFQITKTDIKTFFETTYICGTVSRVDFVSFNNNKGAGRRAFVHFSNFTNNVLKEVLLTNGNYDVCLNGANVRLIINNNPVPETKLNLNQVAHNTEFIGEEVKIQQDKITELENKIKMMENMYGILQEQLKSTMHQMQCMYTQYPLPYEAIFQPCPSPSTLQFESTIQPCPPHSTHPCVPNSQNDGIDHDYNNARTRFFGGERVREQ